MHNHNRTRPGTTSTPTRNPIPGPEAAEIQATSGGPSVPDLSGSLGVGVIVSGIDGSEVLAGELIGLCNFVAPSIGGRSFLWDNVEASLLAISGFSSFTSSCGL